MFRTVLREITLDTADNLGVLCGYMRVQYHMQMVRHDDNCLDIEIKKCFGIGKALA